MTSEELFQQNSKRLQLITQPNSKIEFNHVSRYQLWCVARTMRQLLLVFVRNLTTRIVCLWLCIRMFMYMSDFNNYMYLHVCVWMHLAKSEIRMKYKEGGLTGGAVVLDDLFRVRVRVCFFFCFCLNGFCFNVVCFNFHEQAYILWCALLSRLYAFVYVCMYVCACVCMYVCMHVCVYMRMRLCHMLG